MTSAFERNSIYGIMINNAMENKKYKFIEDDVRIVNNRTRKVHRIVALRDFSDVKKGDLGGYAEKEENLSHEGFAWVYDDGIVFDNARVINDATVHNYAVVCRAAVLRGSACAKDYSIIGGEVVCRNTVCISEKAIVWGDIKITGDSHIYGNVSLNMSPITLWDADISQQFHVVSFHGFGSRFSSTAVYRNKDGGLYVTCGCFKGTIEEFKRKVHETHGGNQYAKEYRALIRMVLNHNFGLVYRLPIKK